MATTRRGKRLAETSPADSPPRKIRDTVKTSETTKPQDATTTSSKAITTTSPTRKRRSTIRPTPTISSHRMRTRARDRIFPFSKLPAEIRNLIFAEAYSTNQPILLSELRLPQELKVPTLFSEGLPFFFETNIISIPVMTNWCVRHQHLHYSGYTRHERTGKIVLPKMLTHRNGIPHDLIRFKHIHFQGLCCCCEGGKPILNISIDVVKNGNVFTPAVKVEVVPTSSMDIMITALNGMGKQVKAAVEECAGREGFNGFLVEDLRSLAKKFRYDNRCAKHREENEDDGDLF